MQEEIITDQEIEKAFENCNFGGADHRKLLEQGVLKNSAGYSCGHTLQTILQELGLLGKNLYVTKKGRRFIYYAFKDSSNSG